MLRAIVAMTLFTAAYVAEIVRGGLQSLPKGQTEAAQALGLSPVRTTFLIVLPQALRNVIPAIVGQFISLFKDTTLAAAAMGLLDLLSVSEAVTSQTGVPGPGPDRRDAGVRHAAVLDRVHHDEPREPAAGTQAGSRHAMTESTSTTPTVFADATQLGGTGEVMIELQGVVKRFGVVHRAARRRPQGRPSRRSSSSSARRARASRR